MKKLLLLSLFAVFMLAACQKTGPITVSFSHSGLNITTEVGDKITFYNQSTGDIKDVFWDFGDGSTSNSERKEVTHTYDQTGMFRVTLRVSNDLYVEETSQNIYIY